MVTLQPQKKWKSETQNLQVGDVVLLITLKLKGMSGPQVLLWKPSPAMTAGFRKGTLKVYSRPVSEVVLLLRRLKYFYMYHVRSRFEVKTDEKVKMAICYDLWF